jgi:protein O-GlcNAc transferase
VLTDHPEHPGARQSLDAILRITPSSADAWLAAGLVADELGTTGRALSFLEEAIRLDPESFPAIECARRLCLSAGLHDKAIRYCERAYRLNPSDDIRLARALSVRAVEASVSAVQASRTAYEQAVDDASAGALRIEDVAAAIRMSPFYLAYHGDSNAELQRKTARLVLQSLPSLTFTAPHCAARSRPAGAGKIRVGFISAFLYEHSIGRVARGLISELSREIFEVTVLRIMPSTRDQLTERLAQSADRFIELDPDYRVAREQIAALGLDVLFYQDIGMERTSYLLAFARLAPVQCVSFGHPDTTGIPSIDYFVSTDLFEPPDGRLHYTEQLFLLRDLPTLAYYYPPPLPASSPDRTLFGLHGEDHVYLCGQTAYKLHPELDALFGAILRRDPRGILVLIRAELEDYDLQIEERLTRTLDEVRGRVLLLDSMAHLRYMQLLSVVDVCLDTPHFNGMISSLDAFATGVPIVTLPGRLQRGRYTQAMYRKMGILDCIAATPAQYIDIAVRLGCDREFARAIRGRIAASSRVLYENRNVVTEFERFFVQAVRETAS